jgi:hypothetical protein
MEDNLNTSPKSKSKDTGEMSATSSVGESKNKEGVGIKGKMGSFLLSTRI